MKSSEALRSVNGRDPASLPDCTALRASLRHLTASRSLEMAMACPDCRACGRSRLATADAPELCRRVGFAVPADPRTS
jgi:hypothetical protein